MSEGFEDKVIVVTGAAGRLGEAIATELAGRHATLVLADRDLIGAIALSERFLEAGGRASAVKVDLTDADSVTAMVDTVIAQYGRIDHLVNNAGVLGPVRPLVETVDADVFDVFNVNVVALVRCTRLVARHMLSQGQGTIVNIASTTGKDGARDLSVYAASKAAVIALTKSWAKELADGGIRVNCVTPGLIEGEGMKSEMPEANGVNYAARNPMRRCADPSEVAHVVSFLLSERTSFVTGAAYDVSGGMSVY